MAVLRELSIRAYVRACRVFTRIEEEESELEHAAYELGYEWEHIIHTAPAFVANVTGGQT